MNLNSCEIIKTFLKVNSTNFLDKPYYSLDKSKNKITLFDKIEKSLSGNSTTFLEDKIFTELDENSYIYEEICLNAIQNSLKGISFSFIFYGDTSEPKYNLSIGDIKEDINNYNNYGLYIRLIDNLIKGVKELNGKKNKNIFELKISYFLLHDSDIYDLADLKQKNLHLNNNFSFSTFNNFKHAIKTEENIIPILVKLKLENLNDELIFLSKILNILFKLENSEKNNILSRSHFCISLYINNTKNPKKNSLINFLILNGNENLYYGQNTKFKIASNSENKKLGDEIKHQNLIEGSKISLETQYTYETLFNLIKLRLFINNNTNNSNENNNINENDMNLLLNKKKQNSKLSNILYNLYSPFLKINFRIVGVVTPSPGQHQIFKDVLLYLLDFTKLKNKLMNKESKIYKNNTNNNAEETLKNLDSKEKTFKLILEQKEKLDKKENQIFILQNDIIGYKKTIKEIKKEIEQRNKKIAFLEKIYNEQVNILKKKLDFKGDINLLISGDDNCDEIKYIKKLKDVINSDKKKEEEIKNLNKKLEEKKEEINQLKNRIDMLSSSDTMIKFYLSSKKIEKINSEKKEEYEDKNKLYIKIENLEKEIALKNKLILKYKEEIGNKNKILLNLPSTLKSAYTTQISINTVKNDPTHTDEENKENKNNLYAGGLYENEINNLKKENNDNIRRIKMEYDNLLKNKNEELKNIQYECDKIKIEKTNDINKYTNEIVRINKLLMNLLSNYKRIFSSNLTPKINFMNYSTKIEEFNDIITSINSQITYDKFPLLYDYLLKNKQLYTNNHPFLHFNIKKIYEPISKNIEEKEKNKNMSKDKIYPEKIFMSEVPKTVDEINNYFNETTNNKKLIMGKERLELMSKEELISHCMNLNNKFYDIENYLKKYTKYKKGFRLEEDDIKDNNEIIKELKDKVNRLNIKLEEQIIKNNKNEIIVNAQKRRIERFQNSSTVLLTNFKNKKQSSSILTPNKSTLYNSSLNDFNANLSDTTNKNNYNKSIKKSNSCISVNKNKRPLSHFPKRKFQENKIGRNYKTNSIQKEFYSKSGEFLSEHEKYVIDKTQGKK